jgi:hypothetical protein
MKIAKVLLVAAVLALIAFTFIPCGHGQLTARPYVYGGAAMSKAGYNFLSATGGVGVTVSNSRFTGFAEGWADDAHKSVGVNGHDLGWRVRPYVKLTNTWFIGAGAQGNCYTDSNFTKGFWRPTFGLGRERSDGIRWDVTWITHGTDRLNGVHGGEFRVIVPLGRNLSLRQTGAVMAYHDEGQRNSRRAAFAEETLVYTFGGKK